MIFPKPHLTRFGSKTRLIMRTKYQIISFVAVLCLMASASCQKDFTGKSIKFRASTRPDAPLTKTAYSGKTYTSSGDTYERIDWKDGDQVILAMKNDEGSEQMAYELTGITAQERYSKAGLSPSGSINGLVWGTGTHDFWAGYPETVTVGEHTLSSVIPSAQNVFYASKKDGVVTYNPDMTKAFMVAGLQGDPSTDSSINLDFDPAITTFEFTIKANNNFVVTAVELETETSGLTSNVDLCGTALATFNPSSMTSPSFSYDGSSGKHITVAFKDASGSNERNPAISTETAVNFKLFALPLNITGLRLKVTLGTGATRSINLKQDGNWITFPARRKINISGLLVPGAEWFINFDGPRQETWVVNPDIEIGVE